MPKNKYFFIISLLLPFLCFAAQNVDAQSSNEIRSDYMPHATDSCRISSMSRPVTSLYALEIGGSRALSTYLSPIRYSGPAFGAYGAWGKALPFSPLKWIMDFEGELKFKDMMNPAGTAKMYGLSANFNWSMSYRWKLPYNIQLSAGAGVEADGGLLYLSRNGNNPVAADVSAAVTLRGAASWHFKIGRLPVIVTDRVSIPSAGAFFSPQYGETYYEIYLGNHSGLAHFGWWGNRFCIDNRLGIDLDFGRTALHLGYHYNYRSSWVCNLNTQVSTHSFVIGVIPGGCGLKKKLPKTDY